MYHIAHSVALTEYLLTLYFWPEYKQYPYVTVVGQLHVQSLLAFNSALRVHTVLVGIAVTLFGQVLRSTAMIHAGSSFSHVIAYRKLNGHVLVTGGIYRCVIREPLADTYSSHIPAGSGIPPMLASFTGH